MLQKFPKGARVVFIGDSITAENLTLQWIINAYKRLPEAGDIRFFNCGVAGGTAEFAITSYESDIRRYRPTHAVVSFGINDSRRDLLLEKRSEERHSKLLSAYRVYQEKMSQLVDILIRDGIDVTLCTPVPYDEYSSVEEKPLNGGYALMIGYAEFVRELAKEKGVHLYDQHKRISNLMASGDITLPDRIHPAPHGYYVLARELLSEQGIDVGEEILSDSFKLWHSYVARLRKVLASECMLIPMVGKSFDSPTEEKLFAMQKRVDDKDFIKPVFESFFKSYVSDKPHQEELYALIDDAYENEIMK